MITQHMNNKDQDTIQLIITRYLEGNATEAEIHELESWISESDQNLKLYHEIKNIWDISVQLPVDTDAALQKVLLRINRRQFTLKAWNFVQKAAAILFIPMLIGMLWMAYGKYPQSKTADVHYHNVVAAFGTFATLELPDGSKVWLNSGSSLKYPEKFTEKSRTVYLSGEAYFEVHSDRNSPFHVSTQTLTVTATGTHFNVMSYKNSRFPSVTLLEGKVAVEKTNSGVTNSSITILKPDQYLQYDTLSGKVNVNTGDTYKHIAWKDGKLVFRNDLFSDVVNRISLQYNVDIEIIGEKVKQYRYRATFENESLSELLKLLKLSSPFDYHEISSKKLPDGSYTRKKIIIYSTEKQHQPI